MFEYVYLARPDTTIAGRSRARHPGRDRSPAGHRAPRRGRPGHPDARVRHPGRRRLRARLRHPLRPGPGQERLRRAARSSSRRQTIRQLGIRLKLNPLREVIRGKRLVVVDDSIVRGNTQRAIVRMLREAGALEVHVRIASPPVQWPCFYGIDFATRAELIASGLDVEGVRRSIGADTLGYVSLDGLVAASEQPRTRLCMACFDGTYPIPLPDEARARQAPAGGPARRWPSATGRPTP